MLIEIFFLMIGAGIYMFSRFIHDDSNLVGISKSDNEWLNNFRK